MKAITYKKFGPPEVLQLSEVDKPVPKENEVLIRIYATTVAAEDPGMRNAPGINGIFKPKRPILGWYLAGEIETVGKDVTKWKTGDKVYGSTGMKVGTYAEYISMPEDAALAIIPANMNYEEAAAVPNGALTALPFLRDKGCIRSGDKVLIYGASGAVGTSAVMIAKYFGAEVTAVCSTDNVEMVRSLGADKVIDYKTEDFAKSHDTYNIVLDAVGKTSFSQCKPLMKPNGRYLAPVPSPGIMLRVLFSLLTGSRKVKFAATGLRKARNKVADLKIINEMIESGKLKAAIDRTYILEEIAEAHRYVEQGHKKGNVVIKV